MFTKWEQIESWIRDNNFAHWIIYRNRPEDGEKGNNIIADSNFYTDSMDDKIAMTKKYLQLAGGRGYGIGFRTPNTTNGGVVCEIRLDEADGTPVNGVQPMQPQYNIGEIKDQLRKEIQAEFDKREYERLRADLDNERKQFEADRNSALGALVHYFAPIGKALLQRGMPNVAGVDAERDVVADPVRMIPSEQAEQDEPDVFTDEESEKLFELMARFKKVEPDYMRLIEAVVTMAENGDQTYTMAKGFLIK